ncbi:MAG: AMP-binding protein, partial [Bacteroidia bacterium]
SGLFSALFQSESISFEVRNYTENLVAFEFGDFKLHHNDLAYVLYTSGSTGLPKGVMHTHTSAMAFISWCISTFNFKAGDRFISIAPFNFDLSVFDLFASLACGGCLFIPKHAEVSNSRLMAKYIEEQNINVLYSTPTFFNALVNYGKLDRKLINAVSHVLIAGEQLMGATVRALAAHFPEAAYYNLYGPTETNVCLYHRVNPYYCEAAAPVPIGELCSYAKAHLTEKDGLHELWIGGKSLMSGYTAQAVNLKSFDGDWYYNTGDLVERNNSGQFVFRGRSDRMLKRSGFRIEPAEIEACVLQCSTVSEASAVAVKKETEVKIVVFFVATEKITDIQLRNFCLAKLPLYMMPDVFVQVGAMKLNANLKTDFITLLNENDLGHLI